MTQSTPSGCEQEVFTPSAQQLRTARASLLDALSMKFTSLFTTIIANCDMALTDIESSDPVFAFVAAAKQAAYDANEANGRIRALVKECREANQ